jgi:hypothetical protein
MVSNLEAIEAELRPGVLVIPASPRAFDPHEDFPALVRELISHNDGLMADAVQIRLGYLYGDAWPPGWTWVTFILDETASAAIRNIVAGITAWGREWIKKARARDPDAEPIKAVIYGSRGEVLSEVEVLPEEP